MEDKHQPNDNSPSDVHNNLALSPNKSVTPAQCIFMPQEQTSINNITTIDDNASKLPEILEKLRIIQSSDSTKIKSAVDVKRNEVEFPVKFHELECNTDLKTPPSNWLYTQSTGIPPVYTQKHADFSSFLMAHQFPDCIGEVDVVSDAENIKKLLKIPYNPKAHISMMIHRVGKTLLLDEFDIYKYLLRQSEEEWDWLRRFFFDYILRSYDHKQESVLLRPNKSRTVVQNRSLLSKFWYHSISSQANDDEESPETNPDAEIPLLGHSTSPVSVKRDSPISCSAASAAELMPEPALKDQLPQRTSESFSRNIVWNFENLKMLIGADLPIFGGGTRPCVSLRLKDMNKPITVLTGIDYWLDNLMSNVPEVVMCCHLDGIVQKYELFKTEDLPHLNDSEFSPKLVCDIAQNILSFLKTKATKEGHTYWLFKGKEDDVVKLYDLTSLCLDTEFSLNKETKKDKVPLDDNPFTIPVAMLLYRVAKNMKMSQDYMYKHSTIRELLKNSLSLLDSQKYSQIVSSAHYMLSDLYIPHDTDPQFPKFNEEDTESVTTEASDFEDQENLYESEHWDSSSITVVNGSPEIKVSSLCVPYKFKPEHRFKPPVICKAVEERCQSSLKHVQSALQCLLDTSANATHTPGSAESEEPQMAKSNEPIPMPYSPLNAKDTKETPSTTPTKKKTIDIAVRQSEQGFNLTVLVENEIYNVPTWNDKINVLLLNKASLVYLILATEYYNNTKYGCALRCVKSSLHAWQAMYQLLGQPNDSPPASAFTLAGDIYFRMFKQWHLVPQYIDKFNAEVELQRDIIDVIEHILPVELCAWSLKVPCDMEEAVALSKSNLEKALQLVPDSGRHTVSRMLGEVCNELSTLYLNSGVKMCDAGVDVDLAKEMFKSSASVMSQGIDLFTYTNDKPNLALLHCNSGRLLRVCAAYCVVHSVPRRYSQQERHYYDQAIEEYKTAINVLKPNKKLYQSIWHAIHWEYCTTLFTIGCLIQDHPPTVHTTFQETMREVTDIFSKTLSLCDLKTQGTLLPMYQYRVAVIHKRLANMHHQAVRNSCGDMRASQRLAERYYTDAIKSFLLLEDKPDDILDIHMDYMKYLDFVIKDTKNIKVKLKTTMDVLQLFCNCKPAFVEIQKLQTDEKNQPSSSTNQDQSQKTSASSNVLESNEKVDVRNALLITFEKTLHSVLLTLLTISKHNKSVDAVLVKSVYGLSLNKDSIPIINHLICCTDKINEMIPQIKKGK